MPNKSQVGYINNSKRLANMPAYSTVNKGSGEKYTKRYYSSTEAEIYFSGAAGELLPSNGFIDEVVQIQFSIQQNVLPLFGYNSYVYDEVAVGSRLVQGAFSINFTSPNYLFDLLEIVNGDIQVNKNNRALWRAPFSVDIVYGGMDTSVNDRGNISSIEAQRGTLEGVSILSCSQELNIEGQPVLEHYTFVARDYVPSVARTSSGSAPPKDQPNKNESTIQLENVIQDAFLWKDNRDKWFVFIDTNKNYESEMESISIILKSGFSPNNIKKNLIRQKNGRWAIGGLSYAGSGVCAIEITGNIKGSGQQIINKEIAVRDQI